MGWVDVHTYSRRLLQGSASAHDPGSATVASGLGTMLELGLIRGGLAKLENTNLVGNQDKG
jgi:hypothetical protein